MMDGVGVSLVRSTGRTYRYDDTGRPSDAVTKWGDASVVDGDVTGIYDGDDTVRSWTNVLEIHF